MPKTRMRRVVTGPIATAGLGIAVAVVGAGCGSPPPTAAGFCQVYHQQERQYLTQYGHSSPSQPLQDLANAIGAMSDWVPIFERLDQAAPPSIEPDVQNILDALKQEQQAAGQEFSNPLGALASGLAASMMSSASWDHLTTYIEQHCTARGA